MLKSFVVAAAIAMAPVCVFAQSYKGNGTAAVPGPTNNLNNPQAQANMAGEPANAHTVPSAGDARTIPAPVVTGHPTLTVPKAQGVPSSSLTR